MEDAALKRRQNPQLPEANVSESEDELEIDLLELFYYLLERIGYLVCAAILGAAIMAAVSFFVLTPKYEATAKLYVVSQSDSAINLSDLQIGSYLTSDYTEVFDTWEVHEQVLQNLGLDYDYDELSKMVEVTNPSDTRILYVTVTSTDPREATDMANEYARVAQRYIKDTMSSDQPNIFSTALEPLDPVSPRKLLNTALGFLGGLLLMGAVFVVRFLTDDKIKTSDDIAKYIGIPTLTIIPSIEQKKSGEKSKRQGARA